MVHRAGTIINIAGTTPVDDPEYRYKMPAVGGKVEGSGNGIKTALPNLSDVALSLHRSPGEVCKFFGTELGAQTRYNADADRAIVNGQHTDAVLQDLVHRYIQKFVLCPNCHLPETEYKIKSDVIYHRCAACGAKEPVDMSHKLCNYILAEDKKAKKENKQGKKGKDDKDGKSDKKEDKKTSKKDKKKDKDSGSDDDKKKSKKDKKKDKKSSKKSKDKDDENGKGYINDALFGKNKDDENTNGLGNNDDGALDDDDASEDDNVSEAGVDDEGALDLAVEATKKFLLAETKNGGGQQPVKPKDLAEVVTNQQMASALKSQDKVTILALATIAPATFFKDKEIAKYAPAFHLVIHGNAIMERHLIAALEVLCVDKPKNFAVMLKQFYDEDVLQEEVILEWADEGRTDYTSPKVEEEVRAMLRAEAEPVVAWLQEADSEDDDGSDSSDED